MKRVNFKNSVIALAIGIAVASCGSGGGNKQQQSATTETKTEQAKSGFQAADDVKPLLAKYKLTAEALKPDGTVWAEVSSGQELVRFLLPKTMEPGHKVAFNKMLEVIKVASDNGKILLHSSDESEFDPALFVDNLSVGHRLKYICNGAPVQIYLSYDSSLSSQKPGDKNLYHSYNIHFNYGQ